MKPGHSIVFLMRDMRFEMPNRTDRRGIESSRMVNYVFARKDGLLLCWAENELHA